MSTLPSDSPAPSAVHLPILVLARVSTSAIFMTYPACLSALLGAWQMSATNAGIVQGGFTAAFAISLLAASFLCDRIGAKRVFNISTFLSAVSALLFAVFARSFETAAVFMFLIGLSQGGTYTPAIMLVSANTPQHKKASGVGWVLAGMSAGYVISIFLSTMLLDLYGYIAAFQATAGITILGWILGWFAVRKAQSHARAESGSPVEFNDTMKRRSRLFYPRHRWDTSGTLRDTIAPLKRSSVRRLFLHLVVEETVFQNALVAVDRSDDGIRTERQRYADWRGFNTRL